ncbi:diguanylate cyclase [Pseudomonas sp. RIT778]|nr:diguanylate cyclase [Pseudomonas sp. RIT778]
MAQIILKRLAQEPIAHRTSPFDRVSVSIGIAAATGSQLDTVQGLIAAADQALYQAKGAVRNGLAKSVGNESYSAYTG